MYREPEGTSRYVSLSGLLLLVANFSPLQEKVKKEPQINYGSHVS